jgi:hypothetical protein
MLSSSFYEPEFSVFDVSQNPDDFFYASSFYKPELNVFDASQNPHFPYITGLRIAFNVTIHVYGDHVITGSHQIKFLVPFESTLNSNCLPAS